MQPQSLFAKSYSEGLNKLKYWEPTYEDTLTLLAQLPELAALIYRSTYKSGQLIPADPSLDWAANLAHMMGGAPAAHCSSKILPLLLELISSLVVWNGLDIFAEG